MQRSQNGFSLAEVVTALSVVGLFLVLLGSLLFGARELSFAGEAQNDARLTLQKVRAAISRDLKMSAHEKTQVAHISGTATADPGMNNAVVGLSAFDIRTQEYRRKDSGGPHWVFNILFYSAIADNHDQLYGPCPNKIKGCPHKFIIRRVIRQNEWPGAGEPEVVESRLSINQMSRHTLVPKDHFLGFPTPNPDPPQAWESSLVSDNILHFEVERTDPDGTRELRFQIAARRTPDQSKRKTREGDLWQHPDTEWLEFSVFPDL